MKEVALKLLCTLALGGIAFTASSQERIKFPVKKDIDELITPLEISQKIENLDQFLPVQTRAGVIYTDPGQCPADRAWDAIRRMTFDEKLELTGGWNFMYYPAVPRLGLRPVSMADASQGVRTRYMVVKGTTTSYPGMLALAASWNPDLAAEFGKVIGEECRAMGIDVLLGPGINMHRFSVSGRNFEYMGEDPWLTSRIATSYVKGLQSMDIVATAKHYVGNDQEFCRHLGNSIMDERTLREIYLPPWEAVVKDAGIRAIMTGNNMINGVPMCMNRELEAGVLRNEYGFKGIIMSDWSNTNYYLPLLNLAITSGHSLYMSTNQTFAAWIKKEAAVSEERKAELEIMLEKMVYQNLYTFFEAGIYDRHPRDSSYRKTFEDHKLFARKVGQESICLLKNENGILPLAKGKTILMMGDNELHSGTGSGFVDGYDHVTYADGMKAVYGDNFRYEVKPDDKSIRSAGVVIYLLSKPGGEGYDVPFEEPAEKIAEIEKISKMNKNVIVVISSANPMPMPWLGNVKGLIWAFMLGQERGNALAAIISGQANPSGKLPFSIEKSFKDSPFPEFNHFGNTPYWYGHHPQYRDYWMGQAEKTDNIFHLYIKPGEYVKTPYKEGIFTGYRWYDKSGKPVQFPFGFGLSYTSFEYQDIKVQNLAETGKISVSFQVKNTGKKAGSEIAQLYLSDKECSVERPVKELKGSRKVYLEPGQSTRVALELNPRDFAFWDVESHNWKVEPGVFEVLVGASSVDIRLRSDIELF
jgi:beta-glucosidase